jgi:peptide deformylase
MKIKKILLDPNPILRKPSVDIDGWTTEVAANVKKMFKVMYRNGNGVGLAACQVGWNVRLFIMNPDPDMKPQHERIYMNPVITVKHGEPEKVEEGCLSLPGVYGDVMRYKHVIMKADTPDGPQEIEFKGFPAQIVQHELGHLDGQLCSDLWDKSESSHSQ